MKQCKTQAMQGLYHGEKQDGGRHARNRPAYDSGQSSQGGRAIHAKSVNQRWTNEKEYENFRSHRFRPQEAYGRSAYSSVTPPDHGECIVHRVTAIDQG
jgi:hypothetical protein